MPANSPTAVLLKFSPVFVSRHSWDTKTYRQIAASLNRRDRQRRNGHAVAELHLSRSYRLLTSTDMRSAAATGSSCSQTRTEVQPASASNESVSRSRRTFASILLRQKSEFRF